MTLALTEEQLMLRETARSWLEENSPVSRMRAIRDDKDAIGYSRSLWKEMAEMGWVGIPFPESVGGAGLGMAELGIVLEECGRVLAPEPFVSTVLLGGSAILLGASEPLQKELLPGVCSGQRILALAAEEQGRFDPWAVSTEVTPDGDGYRISGTKQYVLDAHVADQLIVLGRTAGKRGDRDGLSLFLVDADARGVSIQRSEMVDGRNAATVKFEGVHAPKDRMLGELGAGAELLDAVFDRATIGLSAELLGTADEAFERTLAYLKNREQFGVKIGTFQALRHRAADMFCELELARSVVRDALIAVDEGRDDLSQVASAAKARMSDVSALIGAESVQMHGGSGVTDEEEIGLFFKRAKAAEFTLGDAVYHCDRYARLAGY